jgi:hypothetical protein
LFPYFSKFTCRSVRLSNRIPEAWTVRRPLCYSLSALLLEGELYLEAGVAAHHEEEAGVDLLEVERVAPRQADHLSEQGEGGHKQKEGSPRVKSRCQFWSHPSLSPTV